MEDPKRMLDRAYADTLQAVTDAKAGDEEAKWQLQKLGELHKQRLSIKQYEDEFYMRNKELRIKEQQLKEAKSDRTVKIILEGSALVTSVVVPSYWMAKSLTFEQTGTFLSRGLQWVSGHLRLFKR